MPAVLTFAGILMTTESESFSVTHSHVVTAIGDRHDKKVTEWRDSLITNLDSRVQY